MVTNPFANAGDAKDTSSKKKNTGVRSLGWEDPQEEEVATRFSILA